jgi:hypothetical protein
VFGCERLTDPKQKQKACDNLTHEPVDNTIRAENNEGARRRLTTRL